ncbi:hypothetical protein Mapa_012780 [Marchantia paleacea]|nr:hypothetical protein Mapa_012780 [Marchantia paleacea]
MSPLRSSTKRVILLTCLGGIRENTPEMKFWAADMTDKIVVSPRSCSKRYAPPLPFASALFSTLYSVADT